MNDISLSDKFEFIKENLVIDDGDYPYYMNSCEVCKKK